MYPKVRALVKLRTSRESPSAEQSSENKVRRQRLWQCFVNISNLLRRLYAKITESTTGAYYSYMPNAPFYCKAFSLPFLFITFALETGRSCNQKCLRQDRS